MTWGLGFQHSKSGDTAQGAFITLSKQASVSWWRTERHLLLILTNEIDESQQGAEARLTLSKDSPKSAQGWGFPMLLGLSGNSPANLHGSQETQASGGEALFSSDRSKRIASWIWKGRFWSIVVAGAVWCDSAQVIFGKFCWKLEMVSSGLLG